MVIHQSCDEGNEHTSNDFTLVVIRNNFVVTIASIPQHNGKAKRRKGTSTNMD